MPNHFRIRGTSATGIEVESTATNPPGIVYHAVLTWEQLDTLELERHGWDTLAHAAGFLCSRRTCKPCYKRR